MKQCSRCKNVLYCSKTCQTHHWAEHKQTCSNSPISVSNSYLTTSAHTSCSNQVNQYSPVTSLVGRQCLIECYLQGHRVQALWDTGSVSQVCVIDELWKQEYLSEVPLRDVSNLLESPNTLNLVAANDIDMSYIGYVEVTFVTDISQYWTGHSHTCSKGSKPLSPYHRVQCNRTNSDLHGTSPAKYCEWKHSWENCESRIPQPKEEQSPDIHQTCKCRELMWIHSKDHERAC